MIVARKPTPLGTTRLTFGMVPVSEDERARVHLNDFCAMLGKSLDTVIVPHRAPSPLSLASAMQAGRVQLAWISPTLLVTTPGLSGLMPLVSSVREGVTAYHAALFVSGASPAQRVEDLRGARAAWVAPTSASGYLFSRIALGRRGIDPAALFATETFYDAHGRVAAAVLEGRADVGATFAVFEGGDPTRPLVRAGFLGASPGRSARIIDVAGPIPADMIVAVPSVPISARSALTVALQRLGDDPQAQAPIRALFGVDSFRAFAAASLRALVDLGADLAVPAATPSSRQQPSIPPAPPPSPSNPGRRPP